MNKLPVVIVLLLLSFNTAFSQTKEIKGDTVFWYKRNIELQKILGLKNFEQSTDEFNFRVINHGQVIEISKSDSGFSGNIINFIYHTKRAGKNETETLSDKVILSPKQAEEIYNIIGKSKIIDLPTAKKIQNWKQGFDGITYIIEYSDKKTYWFKNYWTPSAQDSIPEALIVLDLIESLSDAAGLQEIYLSFKNTLPKKGCYNSGGIGNTCYISNSLELGYSGATKLPLGFYASGSVTYLGNAKVNSGASLQYNYDNNGFCHLNIQYYKWNILYTKTNISDFLSYSYQNRVLDFKNTKSKFENHQIGYGLNLENNISVGAGFDFLNRKYSKAGINLYAHKWFTEPDISTVWTTSLFDSQINYKAEIFKLFDLNSKFSINRFSVGIGYENFMNYKDLYFSTTISL